MANIKEYDMEKALKFLKEQEKVCIDYLKGFTEQELLDYKGDDKVEDIKQIITEAQEAIEELEEAMKPKTCEGCVHFNKYYKFVTFMKYTNRCEKHSLYVENDFCCNRYDPKDENV